MLLRPFLAATGLAALTTAFLVPPQISQLETEVLESLGLQAQVQSQAQEHHISLQCAGCSPVEKHHDQPEKHHKHLKQHSTSLELNFVADQGRLTVNGFELYPNLDPYASLAAEVVSEKQEHEKEHKKHHKVDDDDDHDTKALKSHHKWRPFFDFKPHAAGPRELGYSYSVRPVTEASDPNFELLVVDLQIIEVGNVFVDGLNNIRVHLIKSPDGEVLISKIEQTASENQANNDDGECTTLICKWRAIVAAQLANMKMPSCAGMLGHKAGGPSGSQGHHTDNDHDHGHHGHHGHHRSSHGWALLFRKLTSHIILPILVGIVAGVTVSILGMIVGTLLVGLWRTFVRGQSFFPSHTCRRFGRSSHRHHKASHAEAALAEEKSALMMSQEDDELPLPPAYKDDVVETEHVERV